MHKLLTNFCKISEFGAVQKGAKGFIYSIFLQPWFCPAALAANAAAFGRSLRWVFQGFPTSEKKNVQNFEVGFPGFFHLGQKGVKERNLKPSLLSNHVDLDFFAEIL